MNPTPIIDMFSGTGELAQAVNNTKGTLWWFSR